MLTNISWQNYWTTLTVLVAAYYIIIYFLYFRNNFSLRLNNAFKRNTAANNTELTVGKEDEANIFESCLNEMATFFEEANGRKWIKEELLYALQNVLKKYTSLKNSSYEETIETLTILQCKNVCAVHIAAEDLSQLWVAL